MAPLKPDTSIQYAPVQGGSGGLPRQRRFLRYGWFWEVLSVVASLGCMVDVAALLAMMNKQELLRWNFFISLNATVAIFITAAESTALLSGGACISQAKWLHFKTEPRRLHELDLFEEASRGPLGSFLLLLRVGWRLGLAGIGAIATILALGVDTFAQQVVQFENRDVEIDASGASFGLTHVYNGGTKSSIFQGIFDPQASTVDVAMQGAVYRGLFNMDSTPNFNCSSRCTWKESYISLGFVSDCVDVTAATLTTLRKVDAGYNMTTPGNISLEVTYSWCHSRRGRCKTYGAIPAPKRKRKHYLSVVGTRQ